MWLKKILSFIIKKPNMRYILFLFTLFIISCGQNSNKQKVDNTDTTVVKTDSITIPTYNFAKHDDINVFIDDLSKAIAANDRNGVAQMTEFPFTDHWKEFLTGNDVGKQQIEDLSAKNANEFTSKYDKLFIPELQNEIKNKKFRGFEKNEHVPDIINEDEYLILAEAPVNKRQYGLAIRKANGVYKIYRTAFSS
jgi:hypothetical protein